MLHQFHHAKRSQKPLITIKIAKWEVSPRKYKTVEMVKKKFSGERNW